ncbi:hypothetical protein WKR88_02665 [Trinickia caryophylli]|uniref:hypothetical protein n=1 Tax=Trinickia caryophylli TaxID=28094 RepID=UPI001590BF06|nr:hypothetical protein [Trinickia caryophylli]WQE13869.1 hypothetical protein U0034_24395 [Trinickia caryophylli]
MSIAIRVDERKADYYRQYKAEVSFDMWPDFVTGGRAAPGRHHRQESGRSLAGAQPR